MKQRIITRTVWMLSLVSLFTDMASEMLYPVMPLYLKEIGFSMLAIGILDDRVIEFLAAHHIDHTIVLQRFLRLENPCAPFLHFDEDTKVSA